MASSLPNTYRDAEGRELYGQPAASQTALDALAAAMPRPAMTAPPAVTIDSALGQDTGEFARADHTHESRLQARRIQITPDASGEFVYIFPKAYAAGIVPIVSVTAENVRGAATRNDASILMGSTTAIQTTIVVTKLNQSITTGILGAVLPIITPQTAPVWVNIFSRAPS